MLSGKLPVKRLQNSGIPEEAVNQLLIVTLSYLPIGMDIILTGMFFNC